MTSHRRTREVSDVLVGYGSKNGFINFLVRSTVQPELKILLEVQGACTSFISFTCRTFHEEIVYIRANILPLAACLMCVNGTCCIVSLKMSLRSEVFFKLKITFYFSRWCQTVGEMLYFCHNCVLYRQQYISCYCRTLIIPSRCSSMVVPL